jgi:hypothetical protein
MPCRSFDRAFRSLFPEIMPYSLDRNNLITGNLESVARQERVSDESLGLACRL